MPQVNSYDHSCDLLSHVLLLFAAQKNHAQTSWTLVFLIGTENSPGQLPGATVHEYSGCKKRDKRNILENMWHFV